MNDLVEASANGQTLAIPVKFPVCLETFLGLQVANRDDMKPIEIMKAITGEQITTDRLAALRDKFCEALAITT